MVINYKTLKRIYSLCIEGLPAKKIAKVIGRDKSNVSRTIKAFVDNGFLVCINPSDKVKFYEATRKKLSPRQNNVLATIQQSKTKKNSYGGYYTRCHGISYKASVLRWKKIPRWDYRWETNGTLHSMKKVDDFTFIRHKSKYSDTLSLIIPDLLWNVRNKGSVNDAVEKKAMGLMRVFAHKYGVSLSDFKECSGTSYAIPVRNPVLVRLAQEKTVYFGDDAVLDASHGVPEFEGSLGVMQELLSLPHRVSVLEKRMDRVESVVVRLVKSVDRVSSQIERVSQQMSRLEKMFDSPVSRDEFVDVT